MKLRLSLELPQGEARDITLSCDVTATVADVSRCLLRTGLYSDPHLVKIAEQRLAPVTLLARREGEESVMLDPMAPLPYSGLQSGMLIQPVPEFDGPNAARRLVEPSGFVEVLSGEQRGSRFSLLAGNNLLGRDRLSRIQLVHRSVSRRHANIMVGPDNGLTVTDLGSANGVVHHDERRDSVRITESTELHLGNVQIRLETVSGTHAPPQSPHQVVHTRSPRVAPSFPPSTRTLPTPPARAARSRVPVLAMLAPMIMGGALFAITRSPLSLMMVAFTPMMMIGSWLDNTIGARRKHARESRSHDAQLQTERDELLELSAQEVIVRSRESPTTQDVCRAIEDREALLWTRRPEHDSFLEVRFGDGVLPSRTRIDLPERGDTPRTEWNALRQLREEFGEVSPVPVTEHFTYSGSIGVVGERRLADAAAAALLIQLAGLHSPTELVIACFAGPEGEQSWEWLKWLPHTAPVAGPIGAWQIATTVQTSVHLMNELEGLLESRKTSGAHRAHLPAVVVLVCEDTLADAARLIGLAETRPEYRLHIVWVAHTREILPAACRTFVEISDAGATVNYVRTAQTVELTRCETLSPERALGIARRLAPVEDRAARVLDESDLPRVVHLRELHHVDVLGGWQSIAQSWARSGSLVSGWTQGQEREATSLAAIVGQGAGGPAVIDLRLQGPHALVGGTTGAGKSEFLQTWIMSLAADVSPDRLTFLLVDYKGGAAFAECVDLPHTVGLVTDLSGKLVRRALTSLRAELRYREQLLATHGAKDLLAMERVSDAEAPPVLVIVIDEFAALARDVPEFVDGVLDVAQRGRSLGLHLIMATQRPAGVISDNLRANTNLRVGLRMADEADSSDVLGVADAAMFDADLPGRGALKTGPGRAAQFQTAYLGGKDVPGSAAPPIEVRSLGMAEGEPWNIPLEKHDRAHRRSRARDIERVRDGIVAAARRLNIRQPRRPWLDELPALLPFDVAATSRSDEVPLGSTGIAVGLRDDPGTQTQHPVYMNYEEVGNVAILGASGTGKTSALITLAVALSVAATKDPVHIYAIDASGGGLAALAPLPTVGASAVATDSELVGRVLRYMCEIIASRGAKFAEARAHGLTQFRTAASCPDEPRVVLIIDGLSAFRQLYEYAGGADNPLSLLQHIMLQGRAVGVHVVLTGDRPAAIPAAMSASLQQQYVFRLANAHDYGAVEVRSDMLEDAPPGRAVIVGDTCEMQFAIVGGGGAGEHAAEIERVAALLTSKHVAAARRLVNAPERVFLGELPKIHEGSPVIGIEVQDFAPLVMPLQGLGVVAGPSGSGVTTAVLSCVTALEHVAEVRGESLETVLLSCDPQGLATQRDWGRVAQGHAAVGALAAELVAALGGAPVPRGHTIGDPIGDSETTEERSVRAFPKEGRSGVIVIERPGEADGTPVVGQLAALAKVARRANVLVLCEWEIGAAHSMWELYQALKQPSWGLSLQPDQHETQSPFREDVGRVKRSDFPPGRGVCIHGGEVRQVQIALPG